MNEPVSRREFVRSSVAGAAALPLIRLPARPRRRIKKAVKLGMVKGGASLRQKFDLLAELGFDGVEPDSPNDLDTDELIAARDATGIEIHGVVDSVHWRKPFSHPDASVRAEGVAALRTAVRDAAAYGASTVLVVPAVVSKKVGYAEAWERSIPEIAKVLPLAKELGIRIAFENVWNHFLLSPLEFARYIDAFESPLVGAYFDVGNVVKFGWPEQWIRILGKRIFKLDIKGYSRSKGWCKIGDGDAGWPDVRAALDDIGYGGWATAEVAGGDKERLRDIAARMDRVLGL